MDTRILLRIFLRTYMVGATFNTKGMQNVGLAYIMDPGLRALYAADPRALRRARGRYLKHYNTHPFWTPLLVGIFLSMEKKIALGMLPADILPKLRSTTVYTLSALGDSFFGGSFLVLWSLVGVNLAAAGCVGTLAVWICLCFGALQLFKMYTFGRGYAQGLSFLQRLKSWNLIDWGQRLKLVNSVLVALFLVQAGPSQGLWALAWGGLAGLVALAAFARTRDRALILAALVLGGLLTPWEKIVAFVSM
ncbi:MAG: PTS system mannose/fructose/sorbose family transporter subunit IID [Desulfomicrobium sp.]